MRCVALAIALAACGGSSSSPGPAPAAPVDARVPTPIPMEISDSHAQVDLPAVPPFDAKAEPGFRSIAELRLARKALFGTPVKVRGYVTFVYDCVDDVARDGEARDATQRRVDADPTLCVRPWIKLGPTPRAAPSIDLDVVEVARAPRPDEVRTMTKDQLATWPPVPVYALGDEVIVTGTWTDRAPHGTTNSDGLIVYGSIERVTP